MAWGRTSAAERGGHTLQEFKDVHLKNGPSHGQNLVLTVLYMLVSLDNGIARTPHDARGGWLISSANNYNL